MSGGGVVAGRCVDGVGGGVHGVPPWALVGDG
jgi:hypothetical protein